MALCPRWHLDYRGGRTIDHELRSKGIGGTAAADRAQLRGQMTSSELRQRAWKQMPVAERRRRCWLRQHPDYAPGAFQKPPGVVWNKAAACVWRWEINLNGSAPKWLST